MNPDNKNIESETKLIEDYSIGTAIYGIMTGAAGLLAFEKFIEGRYAIGIASTVASALCGLMTYIAIKNINKDAKELSARSSFYRNMYMESQRHKDYTFQNRMNQPENIEKICESNESAKVLPFKRSLRLITDDDDPSNPAA